MFLIVCLLLWFVFGFADNFYKTWLQPKRPIYQNGRVSVCLTESSIDVQLRWFSLVVTRRWWWWGRIGGVWNKCFTNLSSPCKFDGWQWVAEYLNVQLHHVCFLLTVLYQLRRYSLIDMMLSVANRVEHHTCQSRKKIYVCRVQLWLVPLAGRPFGKFNVMVAFSVFLSHDESIVRV